MGKPRKRHLQTSIGRFRAEKGLSQAELADRLGVSQNMLSDYERGQRLPSRPVMLLLDKLATDGGGEDHGA